MLSLSILYSSTKIWSYGIKNHTKQIPIAPKEEWFDQLKSPGCMQFDPYLLQNKFPMHLKKTGLVWCNGYVTRIVYNACVVLIKLLLHLRRLVWSVEMEISPGLLAMYTHWEINLYCT